jgi:hypothetical protein
MMGVWKSVGEKPQIAEGTELAVRMRGTKLGESAVEEVEGFYLNALPLPSEGGCECFDEEENPEEYHRHNLEGCPYTGFYFLDPDGGEEAAYLPFYALEWCKR